MLKNRISKIFYTAFFLFITLTQKVHAGFLDDASIDEACMARGSCSLDDVAAAFISLIRLLLGAIAAIALVLLVWGGVQWVWSGGNADKVKRGKDIFFNTIAALVLAFGSYMIVSLFINDILQPKVGPEGVDYRVTSEEGGSLTECVAKPVGETCNLPVQNYICSGPDAGEQCKPKCEVLNNMPENLVVLGFYGWAFGCASLSDNPEAYHLVNYCPGDADRVCILYDSSGPVLESDLWTVGMRSDADGIRL